MRNTYVLSIFVPVALLTYDEMKTLIFLFLTCIFSVFQALAQSKDTIHIADFGATPYSYENAVTKIQSAIEACKQSGAKVLVFENGRYDIWPEGAIRKEYFITNTSTEEECPSKVKTVGLLFEGLKNLTVEGNGATLMFHGEMTTIALERCQNMTLNHLHVDFERPAGSEMTYTNMNNGEVEVTLHRDSRYQIVDGKMSLVGEGWRSNRNHCIEYDPELETFIYSQGWNTLAAAPAKEIVPGIVRFSTPANFSPKMGNTLTIRDIIRDQVGMFILESKDVTLNKVEMNYMHGLGIVSQYVENVTMNKVKCKPRENSGRLLAASADMMHFSGCKGKVTVDSCYFAGAQDDPINVHGTNLRAIEKVNDKTLKLRFMHGQSYGFNAYFPGDTVAFVHAASMERFAQARVESVKRLSDQVVEVTFDNPVPQALELNHDCVENLTCTPEVAIRNSYFTRTSTRGTLVTTPRKVVIENNTYYKTGMSGILIEGDAEGWYESGPVCDVLIKGNTFIDCAYSGGPGHAIIALNPSNTVIDANRPVHRNVRIEDNVFKTFGNPVLYAKSTADLSFKNNTVVRTQTLKFSDALQPMFYFNGCKGVLIKGTTFEGITPDGLVKTDNMKKGHWKYSK